MILAEKDSQMPHSSVSNNSNEARGGEIQATGPQPCNAKASKQISRANPKTKESHYDKDFTVLLSLITNLVSASVSLSQYLRVPLIYANFSISTPSSAKTQSNYKNVHYTIFAAKRQNDLSAETQRATASKKPRKEVPNEKRSLAIWLVSQERCKENW